jgi:NitT/TauT family transport system substrate-binding protein
MRWLALLAVVVLLVIAASLPRPSQSEALKLTLGLWPGVETLVVAREKGLLPKENVQLIAMTWPSAAMRAFGNGAVDAAVLTLDEVLRLREGGYDLRVVMVMDVSTGGDVVLGGADVRSPADLRGKRVGVDLRGSGMVLLQSALQSAGMSGRDVEMVPLNPSEVAAAMKERRVDAVVLAEPWATRRRRTGGNAVFDSLTKNLTIAHRLGCLGPAGLHDMRRGQSPTITLGPYAGDQLSVDHVIPFSVAPQLDKVIANLELMPLRLNIGKRDAMGQRQRDLLQKLRAAGLF